jgi:hypothetical protein
MFGLRGAGQKGARGPAQLAKGELLNGSDKARGRDSTSTNAGQAPEPSRNGRRCFNEVVKDLPLVFLNPTAFQQNKGPGVWLTECLDTHCLHVDVHRRADIRVAENLLSLTALALARRRARCQGRQGL